MMRISTIGGSGPVRVAIVGGGPGSFIGPVHRMAAELDRRLVLVAGAFSADPDKSRAAGAAYGLSADRIYSDYQQLMQRESRTAGGAELVVIATPNHLHLPVARAALEAKLHVLSDKPATRNLAEALELRHLVEASGQLYGLTYTYSGYAMLREARERVQLGELGKVRKVVVEYSQGWLSEAIERSGDKQAGWRTNPRVAGVGGCSADIGVHAFHTAEFVSGLRIERLCAQLSTVSPERVLDDDCNVLLRFDNGAPGVLVTSQIAAGDRNALRLRVYGERGNLDWSHEQPDRLTLNWLSAATQVLHAGSGYLGTTTRAVGRLPVGHPEGLIEALANIYQDFATGIRSGQLPSTVPDIREGVRGLVFVEAAIVSSQQGSRWVALDELAAA